jgi:hypothetical protein
METAQTTMQEVQELIKRVRMDPRANNKPVLGVNIQMLQTAKNGGYPKHMYHETLDAIVVLSQEEEQAVATKGYVSHYIPHAYPKWKYRRNMDAKFEAAGFVEGVEVPNEQAAADLAKKHAPVNAGPWFDKVTDIERLPEALAEDPAVTIARLQGQLEQAQQQAQQLTAQPRRARGE